MKWMKIALLAAVVALASTAAHEARAQNIIGTWQAGTGNTVGLRVPVWNSTDSLIVDGMLVQLDTTTAATTNLKGLVVKRYTGTLSDRPKILGVAAGPIARSTKGGSGNVLIWGYHPNIYMGVSNLGANNYIRPGAVNGAFSDGSDSLSMAMGWFIGNIAGTVTGGVTSGVRYRGRAFINCLGPKVILIK